jgi:hypothetical protein
MKRTFAMASLDSAGEPARPRYRRAGAAESPTRSFRGDAPHPVSMEPMTDGRRAFFSLLTQSLTAAALLVACAPTTPQPALPRAAPGALALSPFDAESSKAAIARVLDDLEDAAARADEARYFALFADEAVFLGTDARERWDLASFRAFAHPHFAAGKAWSFHAVRRSITVPDDQFAYFDEDLATEKLGPTRASGVLVSRQGGWKVAQYNLAVVIPNERFAEVRALLEDAERAAGGMGRAVHP